MGRNKLLQRRVLKARKDHPEWSLRRIAKEVDSYAPVVYGILKRFGEPTAYDPRYIYHTTFNCAYCTKQNWILKSRIRQKQRRRQTRFFCDRKCWKASRRKITRNH